MEWCLCVSYTLFILSYLVFSIKSTKKESFIHKIDTDNNFEKVMEGVMKKKDRYEIIQNIKNKADILAYGGHWMLLEYVVGMIAWFLIVWLLERNELVSNTFGFIYLKYAMLPCAFTISSYSFYARYVKMEKAHVEFKEFFNL